MTKHQCNFTINTKCFSTNAFEIYSEIKTSVVLIQNIVKAIQHQHAQRQTFIIYSLHSFGMWIARPQNPGSAIQRSVLWLSLLSILNILRPEWYCRDFADNIFKFISVTKMIYWFKVHWNLHLDLWDGPSGTGAPSQYKDRLSQVWRFLC